LDRALILYEANNMLIQQLNWVQITFITVLGLLFVAWGMAHLFLHSKPTEIDSFEALTARLNSGRPTLLYFYSNL